MKHKLLARLIAAYLLFLILGTVFFFAVIPNKIYDYLFEQKMRSLQLTAGQLANAPLIYGCSFDETASQPVKKMLDTIAEEQKTEIWLVEEDGHILMNSRLDYPLTQHVTIPGFDSIITDQLCWMTGDFSGMFPQDTLSILAPVTSIPHITDFVILHYPLSLLKKTAGQQVNFYFIIILIIYLFSLILPISFYLFFYRPLLNTRSISDAYASGALNIPSSIADNDEFSQLQANMQYMAEEIRKSGEYQRNFVSNISHDFRSPLTSIKGYTEAMLDGTIPPESQNKCLDIILTETERLIHLTQNILTFNNLKENGVLLDPSDFDINMVIRTSVASLEIQCRKKDVQIISNLNPNPLFVNADKEKIQQVIYNLLDNAIKFSYPHSAITISTTQKKKYVFVSVKDSGQGIPAEDIPKIWNRFYKSDSSRGKDKSGTGLGLSIVQEILKAHGQNINVVSTEGVGSEFIFTVDKA